MFITNTAWVRARLCNLQKRMHSTRSASDKAYQLLAHGRWFSPGTPVSSITKTGRHEPGPNYLVFIATFGNVSDIGNPTIQTY
jgi:hypothetical protein